jgi:hypothetical protein
LSDVVGGEITNKKGISAQLHVSVGGWAIWQEQEANARLIAAAPDLLDFAKAIDASWTEYHPSGPYGYTTTLCGLGNLSEETIALWKAARAAIAKAEGKTQ